MNLVERHYINKNHRYFKECDILAFKSKNLYNEANYVVRQEFINNNNYLNCFAMQKALQGKSESYLSLPAKVSQQVLRLLDKNWKSFFKSIKDWSKNPTKYKGRPKLPNYKHKVRGRNSVIYDAQAISKRELKKGKVKLSKTNISLDYQHTGLPVKQARITFINQYLYIIEIVYKQEEKAFKDGNNVLGIDLGINNLAACISNNGSFLINGKPLKSINRYYNKKKAKLMSYIGNRGVSNRIIQLTNKRNNKVNNFLHKASRRVINYCLTNDVSKIVIGYNEGWKRNIKIGKVNNQKFVGIPFLKLVTQIEYKGKLEGIEVIRQEESYTSKCSFLDNEDIKKHTKYVGKRVKRGLFKTKLGKLINADINGAGNILKKSNSQWIFNLERIEGFAVNPKKLLIAY